MNSPESKPLSSPLELSDVSCEDRGSHRKSVARHKRANFFCKQGCIAIRGRIDGGLEFETMKCTFFDTPC